MNIQLVKIIDQEEAAGKGLALLKNIVDKDTLLLLSGGTSSVLLYQLIAKDGSLKPGAVAMVDERYGDKIHANSNQKMMIDTGLIPYLDKNGIQFYPILQEDLDRQQTAVKYEETLKNLVTGFKKKVAIMGIGADGHTAGIKPGLEYDHSKWVIFFDDKGGYFSKRITTTFEFLEQIDEFVILIFGSAKKEALQKMLESGFYKNSKIPTTVFTDITLA